MKKYIILGSTLLLLVVGFLFYSSSKPWMLSLYRGGTTILRIDYSSKEACLSAGHSYMADHRAERFDCGYKCHSFDENNLQESPLCEPICNDAGCK